MAPPEPVEKALPAADKLPAGLRPGGKNPLGDLYAAYSEGIHSLSDEECLEVASDVRAGHDYLVLGDPGRAKAARYRDGSRHRNPNDREELRSDVPDRAGLHDIAGVTIEENVRLYECVQLLELVQIRRAIAVDAAGARSGIIAQADIALHASKRETGDLVREVSKPSAPALAS